MPKKKEIPENQENEMLTLMAEGEAAEASEEATKQPAGFEEQPAEPPEESSAESEVIPPEDGLSPNETASPALEDGLEIPLEQPLSPDDTPADEVPPSRPRRRRTTAAASEQPEAASSVPARRRRTAASAAASPRVLAIDEESKVQSAQEKEAYLWMELRNSLRTKRSLTGVLGGVERTSSGLPLAIVYYKDTRIVLPATA